MGVTVEEGEEDGKGQVGGRGIYKIEAHRREFSLQAGYTG
jgi:hypothetical protein